MSNAKFACAIWPWGVNTKEQFIKACKDMNEVGFEYFESVKTAINLFEGNSKEFKSICQEYSVTPVSFYFHMNGDEENDIIDVERKIHFLVENSIDRISLQANGLWGRPANQEELIYVLKTVEKIGKIAKQYNVVPCIHPHYNTTIMYESEIDFIMKNTDPDYIAFGPDTAHLRAGGCEPAEIFKRYADRIKFTHFKDFRTSTLVETARTEAGVEVYSNFMELGEGNIDFCSVFNILRKHQYDGYLTAELDTSRSTNKESARMNLKYLKEHY